MSHSRIGRWEKVDSQLLVVRSQTANLTHGPSFAHNLSCRCPNGKFEAISDICTSRPFNDTKNTPIQGVLASDLCLEPFVSIVLKLEP
jgi:hypothetical protein